MAWLSTVETDIGRGGWVDPAGGRLTVDTVGARWLASNPTKRGSSRSRDETILRVHIFPTLGARPLSSITRADVQTLVDGWSADHAPSTVGRMFSALRAMFAWAVASDMLAKTPCLNIRLPRSRLVDRPVLDPAHLDRLAAELGDVAPMMWLGVVLGLRWAECAGLAVRDVDLNVGIIGVRQQVGRDGRLGPPKSQAGKRRLAVPAWLVNDLRALCDHRGLTVASADRLLFQNATGGPLAYTNWRRRVWTPACEPADLVGLTFHDLRSMAATALVAAGVDIKTAQTRLGHSSPSVTLSLYARVTAQGDRDAADAVGEFFGPSRTQRARETTPAR